MLTQFALFLRGFILSAFFWYICINNSFRIGITDFRRELLLLGLFYYLAYFMNQSSTMSCSRSSLLFQVKTGKLRVREIKRDKRDKRDKKRPQGIYFAIKIV